MGMSRSHPKSNHRASAVNPSRQFLSDCVSIRSISQPRWQLRGETCQIDEEKFQVNSAVWIRSQLQPSVSNL